MFAKKPSFYFNQDVYHYELNQKNVWYHTKFRPGCQTFLEKISKMYELHMVTFGERSYAHTIASFMDPDKRYFHDRILSRNEIFNPVSKTDNLKFVFFFGSRLLIFQATEKLLYNQSFKIFKIFRH